MDIGYDHLLNSYKRWRILSIAILFSAFVHAQKISVSRFVPAESDLTAQRENTLVKDQNGDECALIRVQTTQKGFTFDTGTLGVIKTDDNHVAEIWVYVPFGVRHISIRHPQLGSLVNYEFPINIEKARTYIMEITSDKVFVNHYDDSRKQQLDIKVVPANASFTLNGIDVKLNSEGEASRNLLFGTHTYTVVADKYQRKKGTIVINDSVHVQQLVVNLKPLMGKISVHTNPYNAEIMLDGIPIPSDTTLMPYATRIGNHKLIVKQIGYKTEERDIRVEQDKTTNINVSLSQVAMFSFMSNPTGAIVSVGGEKLGTTPCQKELETGSYEVSAKKVGYKDYRKKMDLSSSSPNVNISLSRIYNYKNEFYAEAGIRTGSFVSFGGTIGGYISNVNVEVSAFHGTGNSETIYWSGNDKKPVSSVYHPELVVSGKAGYGIAVGTRFRIAPQMGINYLSLKESMQEESSVTPANGSNVTSALLGVRVSAIITNHLGVSLSPEYSFRVGKSNGYKELEAVSSKIKDWGQGFNVKFGLMIAF